MVVNLAPEYLVDSGQVHHSWLPALAECRQELESLAVFLDAERAAAVQVLPPPEKIFRALRLPVDRVKVLLVGQDPYPTPGHAVGLAFSTSPEVMPLPRSLFNIFIELQTDLGCKKPNNGDLSAWEDQGVLLLNRVLTVAAGNPGSHRGHGWEEVTHFLMSHLVKEKRNKIVALLWGKDAQQMSALFDSSQTISSAHPSPLSASRGFLGSRPFSRANTLLGAEGLSPIEWCLN